MFYQLRELYLSTQYTLLFGKKHCLHIRLSCILSILIGDAVFNGLQTQYILYLTDCILSDHFLIFPNCISITRFCSPESFSKRMHEISLDSDGKRLLVTSGLVRAPIYQVSTITQTSRFILQKWYQCKSSISFPQVQGHESGLRTLAHSASITSVDWHPTLPMYITGSADNSVRVTSIVWINLWVWQADCSRGLVDFSMQPHTPFHEVTSGAPNDYPFS